MFDKKATIENLIKVADTLDQLGMESDADYISSIIEKIAQQAESAPVEAQPEAESAQPEGAPDESGESVNVEEGSSENIVINMSDDESVSDFERQVYKTIIEGLQGEVLELDEQP